MRALAWWGIAYLVGAAAVMLWGAVPAVPQELPSMLLFIACGMIWNGARLFQSRAIRPSRRFLARWCGSLRCSFPISCIPDTRAWRCARP